MRTPIANGLASRRTPARGEQLVDVARRVAGRDHDRAADELAAVGEPHADRAAVAHDELGDARAEARSRRRPTPSRSRSAVITFGSLFEPMCGRASTRIASGAPCSARISITSRMSPRLCARV